MSLAVALSLLLSAASPAPEAAPVRGVLDAQVAAWNRGDLDAFMTTYWNSPDLVFQSNATITRGFDATVARYRQKYLSDGKEMGRLSFAEIEVELLAPGVALARGGWHLGFRGGKSARGRFTLLLRERSEGWRIVYDHSSGE